MLAVRAYAVEHGGLIPAAAVLANGCACNAYSGLLFFRKKRNFHIYVADVGEPEKDLLVDPAVGGRIAVREGHGYFCRRNNACIRKLLPQGEVLDEVFLVEVEGTVKSEDLVAVVCFYIILQVLISGSTGVALDPHAVGKLLSSVLRPGDELVPGPACPRIIDAVFIKNRLQIRAAHAVRADRRAVQNAIDLIDIDLLLCHDVGQVQLVRNIHEGTVIHIGVDVSGVHLKDVGHGVRCRQNGELIPEAVPRHELVGNVRAEGLIVEVDHLLGRLVTGIIAPPHELHGRSVRIAAALALICGSFRLCFLLFCGLRFLFGFSGLGIRCCGAAALAADCEYEKHRSE